MVNTSPLYDHIVGRVNEALEGVHRGKLIVQPTRRGRTISPWVWFFAALAIMAWLLHRSVRQAQPDWDPPYKANELH